MQANNSKAQNTRKSNQGTTGGVPDWAGLHPVSIVALGTPSQPTGRMMGAQSGVYRFIVMLEQIRLPKIAPTSIRGLFTTRLLKLVRG